MLLILCPYKLESRKHHIRLLDLILGGDRGHYDSMTLTVPTLSYCFVPRTMLNDDGSMYSTLHLIEAFSSLLRTFLLHECGLEVPIDLTPT